MPVRHREPVPDGVERILGTLLSSGNGINSVEVEGLTRVFTDEETWVDSLSSTAWAWSDKEHTSVVSWQLEEVRIDDTH